MKRVNPNPVKLIYLIFYPLEVVATHNFKWVKITHIFV